MYLDIMYHLADYFHSYVFTGMDTYGKIYVYIDKLDGLKNKTNYIDLTGRGVSVEDAAYQYIKLLLSPEIILRYARNSGYITHIIRDFVYNELGSILLLERKDVI